MPQQKRTPAQISFLENYGKTVLLFGGIKHDAEEWRDKNYPGATNTDRALLNYWFAIDHKLPNGLKFAYHPAQRETVESLV